MEIEMGKKKQTYRIRNWKQYNKALVNRGSLTLWFDKNSIDVWHPSTSSGQRGRPPLKIRFIQQRHIQGHQRDTIKNSERFFNHKFS